MTKELKECRLKGFNDGFRDLPSQAISPFYEPQKEYFEGYSEGKSHRQKVDEVCRKENLQVHEVMKKAFDHYYNSYHMKRG